MPAEIPARLHAGMREQRIDATLGCGRIEDELSFPVFLGYGVITADHYRAIRIAVGGNAKAKQAEIDHKRQDCGPESEEQDSEKDPS